MTLVWVPVASVLPLGARAEQQPPQPPKRKRRTSLPVATSQADSLPPAVSRVLSPGEKASQCAPAGGRKRTVPRRAMAPAGSGSPCRSVRACLAPPGFGCSAPWPRPAASRLEPTTSARTAHVLADMPLLLCLTDQRAGTRLTLTTFASVRRT